MDVNQTVGPFLNKDSPFMVYDPISDDFLLSFRKVFNGIWLAMSAIGIIANGISVVTFIKIGRNESVTILFLTLAISDMAGCVLDFASTVAGLVDIVMKQFNLFLYVTPYIPMVYFSMFRRCFSQLSILITDFLAVQRCICVAMPFQVKGLFSTVRTYIYVISVSCFCFTSYGVYLRIYEVISITNLKMNTSQLVFAIRPGSESYRFAKDLVQDIAISMPSPVLVLLCLIIMGFVLRRTVRFRKSITTNVVENRNSTIIPKQHQNKNENKAPKESQALRQVVVVSIIFVVTNLPFVAAAITTSFIPEYAMYRGYHNLYHLTRSLLLTGDMFNSSVNFFVYFKYNSKFRKTCKSWVCKRETQNKEKN